MNLRVLNLRHNRLKARRTVALGFGILISLLDAASTSVLPEDLQVRWSRRRLLRVLSLLLLFLMLLFVVVVSVVVVSDVIVCC
jgi:hypothetical protein